MADKTIGPENGAQDLVSAVRRLLPPPVAPHVTVEDLGLAPRRALSEAAQGRLDAGPRALTDYRTLPDALVQPITQSEMESHDNPIACPFDGYYVVIALPWTLETDEHWKIATDRALEQARRDLLAQLPSLRTPPAPPVRVPSADYDRLSVEVERKLADTADVARRIREARALEVDDEC